MTAEIIAAAAGVVGKVAAKPAADAALRKEGVIRALKVLRLDPKLPPRDFDSLYAYTLIEYCYEKPKPVLAFFRDPYVLDAFRRSFADNDWTRLSRETAEAIRRNAETREVGHLDHGFEEHADGFTAAFQAVVDRSRAPHETRLENKVDELLERVAVTRDQEETHRARTEPGRAEATPAERLMRDVRDWFNAVDYDVRRTWETTDGSVAMLVHVPQRRPGRFDKNVMLCVDGELAPHHLRTLDELVEREGAAEGWGLAQLRVSQAARRRAQESEDRLFCYSFDELIELEADFEPYIAWVEEEVARRKIDVRYVPLSCRKEELDPVTGQSLDTSAYDWRSGGLDDYVEGWLQDPAKKHLSLLGEFGMGKSWFALHLAGEMARGWRDAKRRGVPRPRIPLVIPLRDYAKQTSVKSLLSEYFFSKHRINLRDFEVFRVLNRMGRLLLVFDGFDEMAARADRNTMVANFWELASAVEPGAKVLLSSRTEHFPDAKEARDLFGAKVSTSASAVPKDGPTFEIVELVPFDDEQIELMLGHVLADPKKVRTVMEHEDVRDLMRRPVMSELVMDALPEIEQGVEIDLARIYLYAIQRKMDRDVKAERTFTSRGDKLYFLCEVAWEMLSTDRLTLNYRDFPDRLRACFGTVVAHSKDLDYWEQDMRGQGMLVRNSEGDYGPSHKSLVEFLVAFKIAAELGLLEGDFLKMIPQAGTGGEEAPALTWTEYFAARHPDGSLPPLGSFRQEPVERLADGFGARELNSVVYRFLATMACQKADFADRLLETIRATEDMEGTVLGGNCANLLAVAAPGTLKGAHLVGANLAGFNPDVSGTAVSLAGADLRRARLDTTGLSSVDKSGADFTGAVLGGEEFLSTSDAPISVIAHPSGALSVYAPKTVWHWPTGSLGSPPVRYALPASRGDRWERAHPSVFPWDDSDWGFALGGGGRIIDARSATARGVVPADTFASVRWQGRQAFVVRRSDESAFRIMRPDTLEVLASFKFPTGAGFLSITSGNMGVGLVEVRRDDFDNARRDDFDDAGRDDFDYVRYCRLGEESLAWEPVAEAPSSRGRVGMTHGEGAVVVYGEDRVHMMVDLRTSTAVGGDAVRATPEIDWSHLWAFEYDSRSGFAAAAAHDGIVAWNTRERPDEVQWRAAIPTGVSELSCSADGERLISLSPSGEVAVRSFATGEILSRTSLNPHLKGARFSRDSGLSPAALDVVELSGGVIVG